MSGVVTGEPSVRAPFSRVIVLGLLAIAVAAAAIYIQWGAIAWPFRFGFHFMTRGKARFATFWSLGTMIVDVWALILMAISVVWCHGRLFAAMCLVLLGGWLVIIPFVWFVPHFVLVPFTR